MLNKLSAVLLALAALAPAAPATGAQAPVSAQPRPQPQRPPYTTERLGPDLVGRLLAESIAHIERSDFDSAERAFALQLADAMRRYGPVSLAAGDLQVSFGITAFNNSRDPAFRRRGLDYLRRGVEIHAAVLGRNHPEVGLGYTDIGNAFRMLDPEKPSPEADPALELGWQIRSAALGRTHVEAASALGGLAELKGLPSRTRGDRARIDAAAALFRQAIADFGTQRVTPGYFGSISVRFDLARMYRANGLLDEAVAAASSAQADYRDNFAGDDIMCDGLVRRTFSFAAALRRDGHPTQADALRAGLDGLPCIEAGESYWPISEFILPEDMGRIPGRATGAPAG